jgi:uncharacterized protein (DUF488 family)
MSRILTIGHGLLSIDTLVAHLREQGVQRVVDVRSVPFSQRAPQFNQRVLSARLQNEGIEYAWEEALGGRPATHLLTSGGAPNYEAMAQEQQTRHALDELAGSATRLCIAVLCSETKPETCHRSRMLEPELERRGCEVEHILSDGSVAARPTLFA